jgi:hypothetical protein
MEFVVLLKTSRINLGHHAQICQDIIHSNHINPLVDGLSFLLLPSVLQRLLNNWTDRTFWPDWSAGCCQLWQNFISGGCKFHNLFIDAILIFNNIWLLRWLRSKRWLLCLSKWRSDRRKEQSASLVPSKTSSAIWSPQLTTFAIYGDISMLEFYLHTSLVCFLFS